MSQIGGGEIIARQLVSTDGSPAEHARARSIGSAWLGGRRSAVTDILRLIRERDTTMQVTRDELLEILDEVKDRRSAY